MANTSNILISQKGEYINFYNKASETARRVNNSLEIIDEIIENEKNAYTIDGDGGENSILNSIRERNQKVLNNINNNILPRIRSRISNLNYQIETALIKEAEEKNASS